MNGREINGHALSWLRDHGLSLVILLGGMLGLWVSTREDIAVLKTQMNQVQAQLSVIQSYILNQPRKGN